MSRARFAVVAWIIAASGSDWAGIIVPTRDPHDDHQVVVRVMDDPRVVESRRGIEALRKKLLAWKERDFRATFGQAGRPESVSGALMVAEARLLMLSGLQSANPADNKDHVDSYAVGDLGSLIVYFSRDGESPSHILFYLKVDGEFPRLDRVGTLGKRLDWERPRFETLAKEVERLRRSAVGWEVDAEAEQERSRGVESGDFAEKLKALLRWGEDRRYPLRHKPAEGNSTPRWHWLRGDVVVAEARHARGFKGEAGTPSDFAFYRADGTLAHDETGWPSLDMIRWYRADGEKQARVETGHLLKNGAWRPDHWSWYDRDGEVIRVEADTNGDGIPDVEGETNLAAEPPRRPIAVDQSWAVRPDLIPPRVRLAELPDRRVPVKKLSGQAGAGSKPETPKEPDK